MSRVNCYMIQMTFASKACMNMYADDTTLYTSAPTAKKIPSVLYRTSYKMYLIGSLIINLLIFLRPRGRPTRQTWRLDKKLEIARMWDTRLEYNTSLQDIMINSTKKEKRWGKQCEKQSRQISTIEFPGAKVLQWEGQQQTAEERMSEPVFKAVREIETIVLNELQVCGGGSRIQEKVSPAQPETNREGHRTDNNRGGRETKQNHTQIRTGSKHSVSTNPQIDLILNNVAIEKVQETKLLGVTP